jgi:hypothetical protein
MKSLWGGLWLGDRRVQQLLPLPESFAAGRKAGYETDSGVPA